MTPEELYNIENIEELVGGTANGGVLKAYPYAVENGRIVRYRETKDGTVVEPLCNFNAHIEEEVVLDDGAESTRAFVVGGDIESGSALPSVRIPASRFSAMTWVTESWGMRAVVRAGNGTKDYSEGSDSASVTASTPSACLHPYWLAKNRKPMDLSIREHGR